MNEVRKIIAWMGRKRAVGFDIKEDVVGGAALDKHGVPLSDDAMKTALEADAVLVVEPVSAGPVPFRMLVVAATDPDAAKSLEEDILPKLTGLIPPGPKEPKRETIQEQRISSVPLEAIGPGKQLYFGRHGKTIVFGLNGPEVAESLTAGAKKTGLLGEAKTANALKDVGES
jgi:putative component of toxin-antitoxin plasmid stabilization module